MRRFTWIKSLLLISTVTTISFSGSSDALASLGNNQSDSSIILISRSKKGKKSSIVDWFRNIFRRIGDGGGNRPAVALCPIWPNPNNPDLLNTTSVRLFIWQAGDDVTVKRIEIKGFNNSYIWSHDLTENEQKEQKVHYTGLPLKPGEYSYKMTYEQPINGKITSYNDSISFDVVEQKYKNIENYKQDLIDGNGAMKRADYLVKQELVADAIQEIFLVQNTSSDWNSGLNEVRTMFCEPPSEQN